MLSLLKRRTATALAAAILATTMLGGCAHSPMGGDVGFETVAPAREKVGPALIRIHVVSEEHFGGRERKQESTGSGVVISADGLAVTNHHVAGKAARMFVTLPTLEEVEAELVGTDPATDIAVIRLKPRKPRQFPFAQWGKSDDLRIGDSVIAMGSPASLSQSYTLGVVSNLQMIMPTVWGSRMELDGEDVGSLVRWIGHDAVIFGGNSGGPLADLQGNVVGINAVGIGSLGGAIPESIARPVAEEIIRTGSVTRAYTGVMLQPLLKTQQEAGRGALVGGVVPDSPAAKAGVKGGDLLVAVNGKPAVARFHEEVPLVNLMLAELPIGQEATLTFERDGKPLEVKVVAERRETVLLPETEIRELGLTARNLSLWTQIDLSRKSREGVLVTSMSDGGPVGLAKPPVREGDVIVRLGDRKIANMEDLEAAVAAITKDAKSPKPTVVAFEREGKQVLTVANIGIEELRDPSRDVAKPWVPIDTQVLTRDLSRELALKNTKGVRVTQVFGKEDENPFRVGDIITRVDGDPLDISEPHQVEEFEELIRQYRNGEELEFVLLRDGAETKLTHKLALRPAAPREMRRYRDLDFEFTVREVAYIDRQRPDFAEAEKSNVMIDQVVPGGWADLARVRIGDRIQEINGKPVDNIDTVKKLMADIRAEKAEFVIMKVQRGAFTSFVQMEPAWED